MKLKRADFITKLVLVLILLFAVGMTVTIRSKTEELRTEIEALHSRAAELEIENAELEYYVEHQDDDDVIGNIARKYWGFVRPDERCITIPTTDRPRDRKQYSTSFLQERDFHYLWSWNQDSSRQVR